MDAGWKARSGASRRTDRNGRAGVHRYHRNFRQFLRGKPSRLERSRAAKLGSDHGDILNRCPVSFCSPPWSSTNHVFHVSLARDMYTNRCVNERTSLTRPLDSPDYVEFASLLRSRKTRIRQFQCCICATLMWVQLAFFFILLFHFVGLLKRREKVLESSSKLWKIFIRGLTLFCLQRQFWKILFSIVFLIVLERGYGERSVLFVLVYLRRKFVEKIEML